MSKFEKIEPFYMVWNSRTSKIKREHVTIEVAEKEAERLSILSPLCKFYVIKVLGKCQGDGYTKK